MKQSEKSQGLHVVIMDGNGRWAMRRGLPRIAGHRAGAAALRRVVERAPDVGISCLTVYAFSSDNWRRPPSEVQGVFWLLRASLRLETERLRHRGARLQVIGQRDRLAKSVLREIDKTECATAAGCRLHLRVAVDCRRKSRRADPAAKIALSSPAIRKTQGCFREHRNALGGPFSVAVARSVRPPSGRSPRSSPSRRPRRTMLRLRDTTH
jgi:undecaprenyl diphosphate synthase